MRYLVLLLFLFNIAFAQQYMSKEGSVHFFSEAPMENIEAENNTVAGIIDVASGEFAFRKRLEDFNFAKSLCKNISMKTTWRVKDIPLRLLLDL